MSAAGVYDFVLDPECPQCGGEHATRVAAGDLLPCFAWPRMSTDTDDDEATNDDPTTQARPRARRAAAKECA